MRVVLALALVAGSIAASDHAALVARLGSSDRKVAGAAKRSIQSLPRTDALLREIVRQSQEFPVMGQSRAWDVLSLASKKQRAWINPVLVGSDAHYLRAAVAIRIFLAGDEERGIAVIRSVLDDRELSGSDYQVVVSKITSLRRNVVRAEFRRQLRPDADGARVAATLNSLQLMKDPKAADAAAKLLSSPDPDVLAACGAFVLAAGRDQAESALIRAWRHANLTKTGVYATTGLLRNAPAVPSAVLDAVTQRITKIADRYARAAALYVVSSRRHRPAIPVIRSLLDSDDEYTVKRALQSLEQFAGLIQDSKIREALESGSWTQKLWAADLLRRRGDERGYPVALKALDASNWSYRYRAVRLLGMMRRPASVEPLIGALDDSNDSVRSEAARSLENVLRGLYPYRQGFELKRAGYRYGDVAAQRRAAIRKIRTWWKANKDADW